MKTVYSFRLSTEDRKLLEQLAVKRRLKTSELVRLILRREIAKAGLKDKPLAR